MAEHHLHISLLVLIIFLQKISTGIELPCDFSFDRKFGYTCRVFNFTNVDKKAQISIITGNHLCKDDKSHRGRSDSDVHRLVLWNEKINYLPGNLTSHFTMLRTLQVKSCGLKALTRSSELDNIRRLYLGFNEIENIPQMFFWNFCRLEILSLHKNQITTIHPKAFRDLLSLKRISLNDNQLESIPSQLFENCINLEVVDLDNNKLNSINGDLFTNQPHLREVLLKNNVLTAIESHFLSRVINLQLSSVQLINNVCINFTYPHDGNYETMQRIFIENCEPPPITTTVVTRTTVYQQTPKPKYKTPKFLYREKCKWKVLPAYAHWYKKSFE